MEKNSVSSGIELLMETGTLLLITDVVSVKNIDQ